jgi:hypothetical protein
VTRLTPAEMETLVRKVNALSPPDRLRLAAELMEHRRSETALPIIRKVADELHLAIMLAERT